MNSLPPEMASNRDDKVIEGFGDEWSRFDQSDAAVADDLERDFQQYFSIFPWSALPSNAVGFDAGCGSGRWACFVAPRVGRLHCCDPASRALQVAQTNLAGTKNCEFHQAGVDEMPFPDGSMDFGYSLGVLHCVPDPPAGVASCVRKLKPGAPFLCYLHYSFDNKPAWFRALHRASTLVRLVVARQPHTVRYWLSQIIAAFVYLPLARAARLAERAGVDVKNFPLTAYRNRSFYKMRTDALDRFGTRRELRYSRAEIQRIMEQAGLVDIRFLEGVPYWCSVGRKAG
jgi:ubiquinone/menaquinone biosynthesis C-methylase UbiE